MRTEIRAGITQQGGTVDEVDGPLGTELRTRVPVRAEVVTRWTDTAELMFAAGEIGPVAGRSHLHSFTASVLALLDRP